MSAPTPSEPSRAGARPRERHALTFLGFVLTPGEGTLVDATGRALDVQPKVFEALVYFAENAQRLVTKDELLAALWPDTVVEEASLTQVVHKLRRVLGDDGPRVLQTVVKRGFRFATEVTRRAAPVVEPDEPAAARAPLDAQVAAPRSSRRRLIVVVAAVAVLTAIVTLTATREPAHSGSGAPAFTRVTRMTHLPERDQEPSLAPDGSWFAFSSTRGLGGRYGLWVQRVDGGDAVPITHPARGEDTTPRVFPDGKAVAFVRCDDTDPHGPGCGVWRVAPLGGDERLLVPDCHLGDVSRAGDALVCMRAVDGAVAMVEARLGAEGTPVSERTLLTWPGSVESLRLAPDGAHLAFLSDGEVWVVALDTATGRPERLLAPGSFSQSIGFDGGDDLLLDLSASGRRTLWAAPLDGPRPLAPSRLRALTAGAGVDVHAELARDGHAVLYTHEQATAAMYTVDAHGAGPTRLDTRTSFLGFSFGRLGRVMAVWDADAPSHDGALVLDLATVAGWSALPAGDVAPLSARGLGPGDCPALGRDETQVALVDAGALVWVELASGRRRVLEPRGVERVRPAFSPDGRSVAFVMRGDTSGIGLIATHGEGASARLVVAGVFSAPAFSPDGLSLVACGAPLGGEDGLHVIDVTTGATRRLGSERSYEAAPIWLASEPGYVWVLVGERGAPRLVPVALQQRTIEEARPEPIALSVPADPTNWGVFDVQARPGGGFVYLLKRVAADIMMATPEP